MKGLDISIVTKDLIHALKKGKIEFAKTCLQMIFLYLEYVGYTASKNFPLIISFVTNVAPFEITGFIEKIKQGKEIARIDDNVIIYYSDDEVIIEEVQNSSEKIKTYIVLRI